MQQSAIEQLIREAFFTKQSSNELQDDLPSKMLNLVKWRVCPSDLVLGGQATTTS